MTVDPTVLVWADEPPRNVGNGEHPAPERNFWQWSATRLTMLKAEPPPAKNRTTQREREIAERYEHMAHIRIIAWEDPPPMSFVWKLEDHEYNLALYLQGGGCAICGRTPEQEGQRLQTDHDHACCPGPVTHSCGNCFRGLVCRSCNWTLGRIEAIPNGAHVFGRYLKDRVPEHMADPNDFC